MQYAVPDEKKKAISDPIFLEISIRSFKLKGLKNISFNAKGFLITPDDSFEMQAVRNGQFVKVEE